MTQLRANATNSSQPSCCSCSGEQGLMCMVLPAANAVPESRINFASVNLNEPIATSPRDSDVNQAAPSNAFPSLPRLPASRRPKTKQTDRPPRHPCGQSKQQPPSPQPTCLLLHLSAHPPSLSPTPRTDATAPPTYPRREAILLRRRESNDSTRQKQRKTKPTAAPLYTRSPPSLTRDDTTPSAPIARILPFSLSTRPRLTFFRLSFQSLPAPVHQPPFLLPPGHVDGLKRVVPAFAAWTITARHLDVWYRRPTHAASATADRRDHHFATCIYRPRRAAAQCTVASAVFQRRGFVSSDVKGRHSGAA